MHDRLPREGDCVGDHVTSRDLFNFWEITGNIPETVQDTQVVTMED